MGRGHDERTSNARHVASMPPLPKLVKVLLSKEPHEDDDASMYPTLDMSNYTTADLIHHCHMILKESTYNNQWDEVLATLNYMTDNKIVQRATFRTCLLKATSSQPNPTEKQQRLHLLSSSSLTAQRASRAQGRNKAGESSPSSPSTTSMDAALQILQLQLLAGWPPDSMDISLIVFAMCRRSSEPLLSNLPSRGGMTTATRAPKLPVPPHSRGGMAAPRSCEKAWNFLQHYQSTTPNLDIQVYDAILTCMVEQRQWRMSIQILNYLQQQQQLQETASLEPSNSNNTSPSNVVSSPFPAISTYRLVMECCVKAQQSDAAVQVLLSAVNQYNVTPSLYSFELVVGLLCDKGRWRQALQLFNLMDELSIRKTVQIGNSVLIAMSRAGEVAQARHLLHRMSKKGSRMQPNVISYNCIISACANTPGRWKEALKVFDLCVRAPGVRPDIYTYTSALRACAKGHELRKALALWQVLQDRKLRRDAHVYTAMMEVCASTKHWEKALHLLQEMQKDNIKPTEVTFSAAISACGNARQWEAALELLREMKRHPINITPSKMTYNNVLTALARASKTSNTTLYSANQPHEADFIWTQAKELLLEMDSAGINKDGFTYSAALTCCQGQWKEALKLIEDMRETQAKSTDKRFSIQPNKMAYTAAISSCGKAGQAKVALELFRNITTPNSKKGKDGNFERIIPDRVMYNALFSALRSAGATDDCLGTQASTIWKIWQQMVQQGRRRGPQPSSYIQQGKSHDNGLSFTAAINVVTPDMITITNALGALNNLREPKDGKNCLEKDIDVDEVVDQIYSDSLELMRTGTGLPTLVVSDQDIQHASPSWEFDMSGLSLPVSRAACRHLFLKSILEASMPNQQPDRKKMKKLQNSFIFRNLILRTGVGSNKQHELSQDTAGERNHRMHPSTSLREYVQTILSTEFNPPIESHIPTYAPATIHISSDMIQYWVQRQKI